MMMMMMMIMIMTKIHWQEESVRLPDGNMIVMGNQKFSAPEIIFQVIQFHDADADDYAGDDDEDGGDDNDDDDYVYDHKP